jgi:hypothetical protein
MRRLVVENGIGIVAEENSPEAIWDAASKAKQLDFSRIKQDLRRFAEHYNWEEQEKVLVKVYENLWSHENE